MRHGSFLAAWCLVSTTVAAAVTGGGSLQIRDRQSTLQTRDLIKILPVTLSRRGSAGRSSGGSPNRAGRSQSPAERGPAGQGRSSPSARAPYQRTGQARNDNGASGSPGRDPNAQPARGRSPDSASPRASSPSARSSGLQQASLPSISTTSGSGVSGASNSGNRAGTPDTAARRRHNIHPASVGASVSAFRGSATVATHTPHEGYKGEVLTENQQSLLHAASPDRATLTGAVHNGHIHAYAEGNIAKAQMRTLNNGRGTLETYDGHGSRTRAQQIGPNEIAVMRAESDMQGENTAATSAELTGSGSVKVKAKNLRQRDVGMPGNQDLSTDS